MRPGCLACLLLMFPSLSAPGAEKGPAPELEPALKEAGLAADGPALLDFFRKRTRPDADGEKIQALVRQLGEGSPAGRDRAAAELVALGVAAVPLLRQALKDPDDREVFGRVRHCLEAIDNPTIPAAAARRMAQLRPARAAEVLLAYLPFADNESVADEVQSALNVVAVRDGQADKAVTTALHDPIPLRRAAAAVALCQVGAAGQIPVILPLLQDPKPTVRLRAALALAGRQVQEAIPVLIDLLGKLPVHQGRLADDFLRQLAAEGAPAVLLGPDQSSRRNCQAAWAAWWQTANSVTLLEFFRKRTLAESDREKIQSLIQQLGDDAFEAREKASTELLAVGAPAAPWLSQAAKSSDVEVAKRAKDCLQRVAYDKGGLKPATAARLLALRKPTGTAEVLLAYLPFAEDDAVSDVVQEALNAVARGDPRAEPVLRRALDNPLPVRRTAAAVALCQIPGQAVHRLLQDPEPGVRLRVALALSARKERDAIPVLIALLGELPASQSWQAEEVLLRLAGKQGPAGSVGDGRAVRQNSRDAWAAWWQANSSRVDLAILEQLPRSLGYTLLIEVDTRGINGRVSETGPDGKARWQITGLRFPVDAQVLPGNRVLITEHHGLRVTERDFKGNILWQKPVTLPVNSQRLANGNTFIATRNLLLEVDRRDREVFSYSRPAHDIMAAQKLDDGQIIYLTAGGMCSRLDAAGKEIKSFTVGRGFLGGLEVLPNGRILVPQYTDNKVVEFDADGRVVWEATVAIPSAATRLSNGHTLVASGATQRVVELDQAGKVVWEQRTQDRPWRARRR